MSESRTYYRYKDGTTGVGSGDIISSPPTASADLEQALSPDSTPITLLGNRDEDTALPRIPRLIINKYGVINVDDSTHYLSTPFFNVLSNVAPGQTLNLLNLYARNTDEAPAKLGQNGVGWLHVVNIEYVIGGPYNPETNLAWFTGEADVVVTTVNRFCEVKLIASDGRIATNYTYNIGPSISWSGWKLHTYATKSFDAGKIIQSVSEQGIQNGEAGFHEDGTFWIGNVVKYQSATGSVGGRMAGENPLFDYDYVNLNHLKGALSLYATLSYVAQIATDLYAQVASKANEGHTHPIGEINGLQTVLDTIINKSILSTGSPHWGLGVDENGAPKMIDNNRTLLNASTRLPSAKQGDFYDFYLPPSLFILPVGVEVWEAISSAAKDWIGLSWDNVTGLRIYGIPTDHEDLSIVIKIRWRFSYLSRWQEDEKTLLLPVLPTTASVTPPSAPTDLNAIVNASNPTTIIDLSWADVSSNEDNFVLERSLDNITWSIIATLGANVTVFQDTDKTPNTLYYYRIKATNQAGSSSYAIDSVTTDATIVIPTIDEWVAGSFYVKSWATAPPPPPPPIDPGNLGEFFGGNKPLYKIVGLQPAAYVQADRIIWMRKDNNSITKVFGSFDLNNSSSQEIPDSNIWTIKEMGASTSNPGPTLWINNASDAGLNLCDIWIRWETFQVSETRYMTEILDYCLNYGKYKGVFIKFGFSFGCGNGGFTPGFGQDQTAQWRYMPEDVMRMQKFSPTELGYPVDGYPPCLLRDRPADNIIRLFQAIAGHLRNHPNKSVCLGIHPLLANTGESHMPINGPNDGICDASPTTMLLFKKFLLSQNSTVQGWFSAFLSDPLNPNNTSARNFMRGYTSGETYRVWQYWIQNYYYFGMSYRGYVVRGIVPPGEEFLGKTYYFGLYQTISEILREDGLGIKFLVDHGSSIDGNVQRVNNFSIDPTFTNFVNGFKMNPAGNRMGYIEAAAVRATGKAPYLEWTPGALWDFGGNAQVAIDTCTQQTKDTMDSDVTPMFSFVAAGDSYTNILLPIVRNLRNAGYWNQNYEAYNGEQQIQVNVSDLNSGWYNSGGPVEKIIEKFDLYPRSNDAERRAAIRKVAFNLIQAANPAPNTLTIF